MNKSLKMKYSTNLLNNKEMYLKTQKKNKNNMKNQ